MKSTRIKLLMIGLFFTQFAFAQPMFQFSQYMFNDYALNPAIGGTHDYWQIRTNYRLQWAGVPDGPQTFMLGGYGPHKSMPMGYGGYMFNDIVGPLSYTGMYGSYAYNLRISGDIRISMGLFAGVIQHKIDFSSMDPDNPNDRIFLENGSSETKIIPDGSLGVYLYTSQYFFGVSFNHLFFNNLSLLDDYSGSAEFEEKYARIKPYFNFQGGYKYNLNRNFDIQPSVLAKVAPGYDFITDINIRTIYQKLVWGGLGFRYNFQNPDALVIFLGYNYSDFVNIGYSYDVALSKFARSSSGSHEIMIGVKFDDIRKSKSRRKIR